MMPWIAGLLAVGLHFTKQQVSVFERGAATDIRSKLGGNDAVVRVKADVGLESIWGEINAVQISGQDFSTPGLPLFTEPKRSKRGWIHTLNLDLRRFTLNGLEVETLHGTIPDCNFDFSLAAREKKVRLSHSGRGTAEVTVTEAALERFVLNKFKEVKSAHVKIDKDKLFIEGHGQFLIFDTDFSIIAKLVPVGGTKLALENARITLNGQMADDDSKRALLEQMNPVVDLDADLGLHGAVSVERIEMRGGVLKASGAMHIPEIEVHK